jgi:ACS family hexuronate transporter-like MFS transporter
MMGSQSLDLLINILTAVMVAAVVAGIVAGIFFMLSLQRVLRLCAPQNRTLEPGKVWLCFIPLFGMVWIFVVVSRVAGSLRREFESRGAPSEDYGRTIGLAYCILAVTSIIPLLGVLTGLASCACWIIYWVKIAAYSRALEQSTDGSQGSSGADESAQAVEEPVDESKSWLVLLILILAYAGQHLQSLGLSIFIPALRNEFSLGSVQLSYIFSAFMLGLMAGYVLLILVTALAGTRWGLVVALAGTSVAAVGAGLAPGYWGVVAARAVMGFFAGGLLPAAIQSLREWFPQRTRTLAIGLFLASSPLVSLLVSPLTPHITQTVPWRQVFMYSSIPTAIAAVLCWIVLVPPSRNAGAGGITSLGVVSVVMLGVGMLLAAPLFTFAQSWLPMLVRRSMDASVSTISTINMAASAAGAILAGVAAWALMESEISPWKARAGLLTLFGVILPAAGLLGIFAKDWALVAVSAVVMGAFQAWAALLYAAVADSLPARGVCIGAAIGALMMSLVMMLFTSGLAGVMSEYGTGFALGMTAALATFGLIAISLLAWLVHPKPIPAVADSAESA